METGKNNTVSQTPNNPQPLRFDVLAFNRLASTNLYFMDNETMHDQPEGTVVLANHQTDGIGQSGNSWSSEEGKNLTFSVLLRPTFLPVAAQFELHKVLSVAVCTTLQQLLPERDDIRIKWPNDIYVGNRKICGMLVNNKISGNSYTFAVAGIGLNVNQTAFDPSLPNPTSLKTVAGKDFETFDILHDLLHEIGVWYTKLKLGETETINKHYLQNLLNLGQQKSYRYHNETIDATITGIDKFGHLQLQTSDNKSITCDIKEIQYIF